MILPVIKLGTLLIRTLSKPLANRLKRHAGVHPKFRHFIINMAQANHRFTTNIQRRIYGRATDVAIRPLNEEKAIQAAADIVGELFVFSVAGSAIILEVQRNARAEAKKEELRKRVLQEMKQREEDIAREIEILKHRLTEVEQLAQARNRSRSPEQNVDSKRPIKK
ncbi:OPA3-like protein [Linum grandiflorum]